jgi:hypothetical protein
VEPTGTRRCAADVDGFLLMTHIERTTMDDPEAGRRNRTPGDPAGSPRGDSAGADSARRSRWRRVAAWVTTALACLLILFALIAPNDVNRLTPAAFIRIPVEGLLGVALVLVLPARARRVAVALVGVILGLLTILKILDMGFFAVLARPFDPVLDWALLAFAVEFVSVTAGPGSAVGAAVTAVVLAIAVLILMTLSALRLTRLVGRHRTGATRSVAMLGIVWGTCAVLGVQILPGVPVASTSAADLAYERARQVPASLQDQKEFAAQAVVDAFRDTPGEKLLTALHGKDVIVAFVESYGRDAVENLEFAPQVGAVLADGNRRLSTAGFASRSAFLTSPTAGGASWLAHATLLSGLWVDNRLTLNGAFRRANWRTVGIMPAITRAWPEGAFFGYDRIYAARDLEYHGPRFGYATMPDQYTLSAFERFERAAPDHGPVMVEIPLLSSHVPWKPIPRLVDWDDVGDGTVFGTMPAGGDETDAGVGREDPSRVRTEYRRSIEYSLTTLISYVETYGDDDLVLVFLGDHQPTPIVTGEGAGQDVPITIVARDPAVLDRISAWNWHDGLMPGPQAPVWRMNEFRDRFLTAFGP